MPLSRHLTFANVASATALAVALTGGGVAVAAGLAQNSVGSAQIKNFSIHRVDLAAGSVSGAKLAPNAVTGAKIAPDSVTGADVQESTLSLPAAPAIFTSGLGYGKLTGSRAEAASLTIAAPAAGFLHLTAQVEIYNGEAAAQVVGQIGDPTAASLNGFDWLAGTGHALLQEGSITVPVTKGTHTYSFTMFESGQSSFGSFYNAQLTAEFFPGGVVKEAPFPDRGTR